MRKNSQQILKIAQKTAERFEEIMGTSYKKGVLKCGRGALGVTTQLAKEFGVIPNQIVNNLLLSQLPQEYKEDIENGRPPAYYLEAIRAPEAIRSLLYTKIQGGEFSNRDAIRKYIKNYESLSEGEYMKQEETALQNNQEPINWSEYIRNAFETKGYYDPREATIKRFGGTNEHDVLKMRSLFYTIRSGIEKKYNKSIVWEDNVWKFSDVSTFSLQKKEEVSHVSTNPKQKTAVMVIREIRDSGTVSYDLEVLGDLNRGMMKEALKHLMEVIM